MTVNAIAPGFIPTKMSAQLLSYAEKETFIKRIPLGRFGNDDDMAAAALFFASKAGAWVTGSILKVDGGALSDFRPMSSL